MFGLRARGVIRLGCAVGVVSPDAAHIFALRTCMVVLQVRTKAGVFCIPRMKTGAFRSIILILYIVTLQFTFFLKGFSASCFEHKLCFFCFFFWERCYRERQLHLYLYYLLLCMSIIIIHTHPYICSTARPSSGIMKAHASPMKVAILLPGISARCTL